jgi:type II secretory ATPase GspE/PulE/Tfp pilus assembly ATPase PilB-like protein
MSWTNRLLNRGGGAEEHARASTPSSDAETPDKWKDRTRVNNYDALPPYSAVLSATNANFAIPESQQQQLALLETGTNEAYIVCVPEIFGTGPHMNLSARARKEYVVQDHIICDDPTILVLIYDREKSRRANSAEDSTKKADTVQFFESLIAEAIRARATDVHFIVRGETAEVWFRIDGMIRKHKAYAPHQLTEAAGVAFNKLAEETSRSHPAYNVRMDQYCAIVLNAVAGRNLKLRYQSIRVVDGYDVILRLLFTDEITKKSQSLEELGYAPSHQRLFQLASRKTIGVIFIAGVTGSGKSTTLKTLMTMHPDRHLKKAYSVEDPAEYLIPGVSQVSVQRTSDATSDSQSSNPFVGAMRTIMRGDPDEIMVGEVRDVESGSLLKTMVQSGHGVKTTVHAASAFEIVERVTSDEIGLSRHTISSRNFISALVYQRLIAKLCEKCKLPAVGNLDEEYLALIQRKFGIAPEGICTADPAGCPHCNHVGVKGLTVVAEVLIPNYEILKLIRDGHDIEAEELWRRGRKAAFDEPDCEGKTAFEHALYKMSQGILDPRIIEDNFEPMEMYSVVEPDHKVLNA